MRLHPQARFDAAVSQLTRQHRLSQPQAAELAQKFSALTPAQQDAVAPALEKLLAARSSDYNPAAAFAALSLSMPTATDLSADFKYFASQQASLFSNAAVVDSARSQPVREYEALCGSTQGMGRDPKRLQILGDAVKQMTPDQRAETLKTMAESANLVGYEAVLPHIGSGLPLGLPTFKKLLDAVLANQEFSPGERRVVADAFSRLPENERSKALVAAAEHTSFDVHALDHVLQPGERAPFEAFEPYLSEKYLRTVLPSKFEQHELGELGALFNRLSAPDRHKVLGELAGYSSEVAAVFENLAAQEAHPGFFAKVFAALRRD